MRRACAARFLHEANWIFSPPRRGIGCWGYGADCAGGMERYSRIAVVAARDLVRSIDPSNERRI